MTPKQPKQKYRIFTNDVGPMQFSALCDVYTSDPAKSIAETSRRFKAKAIALPHLRKDLWPHGQTGHLSAAARTWLESEGQI